jgi:hypothetical protein
LPRRQGVLDGLQRKLQQIGASIRRSPYLLERMFPRFREQIGTALDLIVEFSTLGEYRLAANGPGASGAPADAPGQAPQLGGADPQALRAAVRRTVAGGATGMAPVATPAARRLLEAAGRPAQAPTGEASAHTNPPATPACRGLRRRASEAIPHSPARTRPRKGTAKPPEQLCLAV